MLLRPTFRHIAKGEDFDFPMRYNDVGAVSEIDLLRAFDAGQVIYNHFGVKIVRISKGVVIKAGPEVIRRDAEVFELVRSKVRHVNLPKIYRHFPSPYRTGYRAYVVMECIHGVSLGDGRWKELPPALQEAIYHQVIATLLELRGVELSDGARVGSLDGGLAVGRVFSEYGSGPFSSLPSLVRYFNLKLEYAIRLRRCKEQPPFTLEEFSSLGVIHGDIAAKNFILGDDGRLWLIDWETAGVYPTFFELVAAEKQDYDDGFWPGLRKRMREMQEFEEDLKKMEKFKGISSCLDVPVLSSSEYLS